MIDEIEEELEDLDMLEDDSSDDTYYQGTNYLKKWYNQIKEYLKRKIKTKG